MNKQLFARLALFIIYGWFGVLKIIGLSPADPLVDALLERTLSLIPFSTFIIILGVGETILGLLFLFPKLQKITLTLFTLHMIAVFAPLVTLPDLIWAGPFVPTFMGQYIIKNLALIAVVFFLRQPRVSVADEQKLA